MDLVFMNTFTDQSMDIGCVAKLRHLFGSLGEGLLILYQWLSRTAICLVVSVHLSVWLLLDLHCAPPQCYSVDHLKGFRRATWKMWPWPSGHRFTQNITTEHINDIQMGRYARNKWIVFSWVVTDRLQVVAPRSLPSDKQGWVQAEACSARWPCVWLAPAAVCFSNQPHLCKISVGTCLQLAMLSEVSANPQKPVTLTLKVCMVILTVSYETRNILFKWRKRIWDTFGYAI